MASSFKLSDLTLPPILGAAMGFVAGWASGALILLAVAVWYGFSGQVLDIRPVMPRVPFGVFSVIFLGVSLFGWGVIIFDAITDRPASIGEGR